MLAEIPLHGRFERLTEELMRNRLSSAMIWTLAGLAALGSLLCGESLPAGQELKVPSFAYEKFKLALKVIVHEDHRLETSPGNYQAWVAIPAGQSNQDLRVDSAKGRGRTIRLAVPPAWPEVSISRKSTRRIYQRCKSPTAPRPDGEHRPARKHGPCSRAGKTGIADLPALPHGSHP